MKRNNFANNLLWSIVLLSIGYFYYTTLNFNTCSKVLTFKIDSINPEFNLKTDDAIKFAAESGNLWNKGLNKNVLKYDPNGDISISFVYDERQRKTIQNNILKELANRETNNLNSKVAQIETSKNNIGKRKQEYENNVNLFETKLDNYNQKVLEVNARGGATENQTEQLNIEKNQLETERNELERQQQDINQYLTSINSAVDNYNRSIDKVNSFIEKINNNSLGEFEQGTYSNNKITLYEYENTTTLKRLMAHELGHALGLEHTTSTDSIMHYINEGNKFVLTQDDIDEYNRVCNINNK